MSGINTVELGFRLGGWHDFRHHADRLTIPVKTSVGARIHVTV
jgi:hypothetical protein